MRITADARERHKYYEGVIEELRSGLQDPGVQQSLGRIASTRLALLDHLYFLDYDRGELSIPRKRMDTIDVPVTVVRQGELLHLDRTFASNNSIQVRRMRTQMKGWNPVGKEDQIQADLAALTQHWQGIGDASSRRTVPVVSDKVACRGLTIYRSLLVQPGEYRGLGKTAQRKLLGRPVVALVLHDNTINPVPSETLFHELRHVEDDELKPFLPYEAGALENERFRKELTAYYDVWAYATALYNSDTSRFTGDERLLRGHTVENLRAAHIGTRKDQFEPIGVLKRAISEQGLDIVYL
jgi:hypothetical protein